LYFCNRVIAQIVSLTEGQIENKNLIKIQVK